MREISVKVFTTETRGGVSPTQRRCCLRGLVPLAPAPVTSSDGSPVAVSYTLPTVSDNSGTVEQMSCRPASGSLFAVGSTIVTCSASDAAGNTLNTTFDVVVQQAPTVGERPFPGPDRAADLPTTGSGGTGMMSRALALVLLGLMLVLSTRRRRARHVRHRLPEIERSA